MPPRNSAAKTAPLMAIPLGGSTNTPFTYSGNYALDFDGTGDFVQVNDAVGLRPGTSAWTLSLWFRNDAAQFAGLMSKRMASGGNHQMGLYQSDTENASDGRKVQALTIGTSSATDVWWYHTDDDVADGSWRHLALVRPSSGDAIIYVDGTAVGITAIADTDTEPQDVNNDQPWFIGQVKASTGLYTGLIDEPAMWNSALSGDNVEWLANNSLHLIPEPSTLILLATGLVALLVYGLRRRRS